MCSLQPSGGAGASPAGPGPSPHLPPLIPPPGGAGEPSSYVAPPHAPETEKKGKKEKEKAGEEDGESGEEEKPEKSEKKEKKTEKKAAAKSAKKKTHGTKNEVSTPKPNGSEEGEEGEGAEETTAAEVDVEPTRAVAKDIVAPTSTLTPPPSLKKNGWISKAYYSIQCGF